MAKRKAPLTKAALVRRLKRVQETRAMPRVQTKQEGDEFVFVVNAVKTRNELNRHEDGWRGAAGERKTQRLRVVAALKTVRMPPGPPRRAVLVRLAPGTLDPVINLPSSLKAVEDAVCGFFGVDDGVACPIKVSCDQRKRSVMGVEVRLSWAEPARTVLEEVEALLPAARDAVPTYPKAYLRAALGTGINIDVMAEAPEQIARLVAALEAARKAAKP
jgi:hypothetical protein